MVTPTAYCFLSPGDPLLHCCSFQKAGYVLCLNVDHAFFTFVSFIVLLSINLSLPPIPHTFQLSLFYHPNSQFLYPALFPHIFLSYGQQISMHQQQISQKNVSHFLITNPHNHSSKSSGKTSQESGGYYKSRWRNNLEFDVQKGHASIMVKCPHISGVFSSLGRCRAK